MIDKNCAFATLQHIKKNLLFALAAVVAVTGCGVNNTGGLNANPGTLAPANLNTNNQELAYKTGFRSSRHDATDRRSRNYTRHQALYNLRTVAKFPEGYVADYIAHSPDN